MIYIIVTGPALSLAHGETTCEWYNNKWFIFGGSGASIVYLDTNALVSWENSNETWPIGYHSGLRVSSVVLSNGMVVLFGGLDSGTYVNHTWYYDTSTQTLWQSSINLDYGIGTAAAVYVPSSSSSLPCDTVYLFGGLLTPSTTTDAVSKGIINLRSDEYIISAKENTNLTMPFAPILAGANYDSIKTSIKELLKTNSLIGRTLSFVKRRDLRHFPTRLK